MGTVKTGFLNLTEVTSKRKTMIPIFWNHDLNLMMLKSNPAFFLDPNKKPLVAGPVVEAFIDPKQ